MKLYWMDTTDRNGRVIILLVNHDDSRNCEVVDVHELKTQLLYGIPKQ
jgi:hypothetical protein